MVTCSGLKFLIIENDSIISLRNKRTTIFKMYYFIMSNQNGRPPNNENKCILYELMSPLFYPCSFIKILKSEDKNGFHFMKACDQTKSLTKTFKEKNSILYNSCHFFIYIFVSFSQKMKTVCPEIHNTFHTKTWF